MWFNAVMISILALAALAQAQAAQPDKPKTPTEVVAQAPAAAWTAIDPDDLLLIDLANGGRVIVQLAPQFTPVHAANIKALARAN